MQHDFRLWSSELESGARNLKLGRVHTTKIDDDLIVCSMVAQHGLGQSSQARIRYSALARTLAQVAEIALENNASVHMPTIGCGQAGGKWEIVQELIDSELCRRMVDVKIYTLPGQPDPTQRSSQGLFD